MSVATDYAYMAGAIDSDGTIGIKKSTYAMRVTGDATQPVYSERVALRQVSAEVPELLKSYFGGSLHLAKPSTENGRPLYSWAATDLRAVECLKSVRRYLRIKADQADNALILRRVKERSKRIRVARGRGHVGASVRPLNISDEMERLYLYAKKLNAVGRQ